MKPPSTSSPASKKLLIKDQKSKPKSQVCPPNSVSSSSITNPDELSPPKKKTRDLPNLSVCHSCGLRINHCNPKDRLQPLDSFWRIVLVCRQCSKRIRTGQTCPYCFRETGNSGNFFQCDDCGHRIHEQCDKDYGNFTPWCYLGVTLGYRVCIDCWVPKLLNNSIKVSRKRSENKDVMEPGKGEDEAEDSLEKAAKKAKYEVEKKIKMAAMAKEKALRKAVVAKNAVEFANVALDFAAKKDKNGKKGEQLVMSSSVSSSDVSKDAADEELAIRLHRAMNSSPRISKTLNSENANCLDGMKVGDLTLSSNMILCSGASHSSGDDMRLEACTNGLKNNPIGMESKNGCCADLDESGPGLITYKRSKLRKVWQANIDDVMISVSKSSEQDNSDHHMDSNDIKSQCSGKCEGDISRTSVCITVDQVDSSIALNESRKEPMIYKRTRFKRKTCQENAEIGVCGESKSSDNDKMVFDYLSHQKDDKKYELPSVDSGNSLVQSEGDINTENKSCSATRSQYFFTYSRRKSGSKMGSNCKTNLQSEAFQNENKSLAFNYGLFHQSRTSSDASSGLKIATMQDCDFGDGPLGKEP